MKNNTNFYKEIVLSKVVLFPKEIKELPTYKAIYLYFKVLFDGLKSIIRKNHKNLEKKDIQKIMKNKPKDCIILDNKFLKFKPKDFLKKIKKDNKELVDLLHFKDLIIFNLKNNQDSIALIKVVIIEYQCKSNKKMQDRIVIKRDIPSILAKYVRKINK